MKDLISVIMSTYNEEIDWVKASVDSILNQSYSNFEFIIVLDNPDNYELSKLLERYSKEDHRIKLIYNKENMGLVPSLNTALAHCNGNYIARMDADDISLKTRFEVSKNYLEKHRMDFVFSGVTVIDEKGNKLYETNSKEISDGKTRKLLSKGNISRHPTWFLKKELYDELGGYRNVSYCEDYDFSLRCLSRNYKIGKMDKNILLYRIRSKSISRIFSLEQFLNSRAILQLYKKNKLQDYSLIIKSLNKSKELADQKEIQKYNESNKKYNYGVKHIKEGKNLIGVLHLIQCIFISKYFILKYIDMMRYKLSDLITYK